MKLYFLAMVIFVACSNYFVQFPINDWLTYGAIIYPFTFLVTELCNRKFGANKARRVVVAGFIVAVLFSIYLSTPKIALASGLAFLVAHLLDIFIFSNLRRQTWWMAPLCASILASFVDTVVFWNLAFYSEAVPILTLAAGDFIVKLSLEVLLLLPYRMSFSFDLSRRKSWVLPRAKAL